MEANSKQKTENIFYKNEYTLYIQHGVEGQVFAQLASLFKLKKVNGGKDFIIEGKSEKIVEN